MITVTYGYQRARLQWRMNEYITPMDIYEKLKRLGGPWGLHVDGRWYRLQYDSQLELACELSAHYHNDTFHSAIFGNRTQSGNMLQKPAAGPKSNLRHYSIMEDDEELSPDEEGEECRYHPIKDSENPPTVGPG